MIKLRKTRWQKKQALAAPSRFYGDDGTVHHTEYLDVETHCGTVVAVWFRCQPIAFRQTEVGGARATDMEAMAAPMITGVQVTDADWRRTWERDSEIVKSY